MKALLVRFGPSCYDDPMEQLTYLRQTSTIEAHKASFKILSNKLRGLSEGYNLSYFLSRLRDGIRLPIRIFNPSNLITIYSLAKIQEENLNLPRKLPNRPFTNHFTNNSSEPAFLKYHSNPPPSNPTKTQNKVIIPVQKISQAQMKSRRERGLCYYCDSKWNPGHKYHNPKLFLIKEVEDSVLGEKM